MSNTLIPTPWTYDAQTGTVRSAAGKPVAFIASRLNIGTLADEAGNMIAAAPVMLAALQECAAYLGSLPAGGTREPLYLAFSAAEAAIAKATGAKS